MMKYNLDKIAEGLAKYYSSKIKFKPRQRCLAVLKSQPVASFLVCSLIFIEYKPLKTSFSHELAFFYAHISGQIIGKFRLFQLKWKKKIEYLMVTFLGNPVSFTGKQLQVGDKALDFSLTTTDLSKNL